MKRHPKLEEARSALFEGMGAPPNIPFEADEFQRQAVESVTDSHDTLVVAPTGAGKTYIALQAITACLELGLRSVYTTPLKALSNTKYTDFKRRFEPKHKVGILTGDRKIDGDAGVVVATTEIYRNELYQSAERYSLVVLDEVHFIADQQRGPVWEESIILTPQSTTLLMLSASISNPQEIAAWLEEVRGKPCNIVQATKRPVELRYGFLDPELGVVPLRDSHGDASKEVQRFYGGAVLDSSGKRVIPREEMRGGRNFRGKRPFRGVRGRGKR
jgi:ATP-dependent RNA helicase HelY